MQFQVKKLISSLSSVNHHVMPIIQRRSDSERCVKIAHNVHSSDRHSTNDSNNELSTTGDNNTTPTNNKSSCKYLMIPKILQTIKQSLAITQKSEHFQSRQELIHLPSIIATDLNPTHASINRLMIAEQKSSKKCLIDTGADVSVIPATPQDLSNSPHSTVLFAANGTPIKTYGEKRMELNLGLRRKFSWRFIIADVKQPIIGADFIVHFGLLIDLKNKKLIDRQTNLDTVGSITKIDPNMACIKAYDAKSKFHQILAEYTDLTNPNATHGSEKVTIFHHIETKGAPSFCRPRRLSPEKYKAAQEDFQTMVQQGICRPSKSPWASALHMTKKQNGEWRNCGDYRALNSKTLPDRYPLPYILDFTYKLHGKRIFSVIDLKQAFYQIPVHPDDIEKTAITTPFGLFEFCYMTFGLKNASQTFQRFMNHVMEGLDFVFVFVDDICIASTTEEEHEIHLRLVFDRLRKFGLTIVPEKCQFGQETVKFLGHQVSAEGIKPLPHKVSAIQNYLRPTMAKDLKSFLATINFYRRFIPKAVDNQLILQALIPGNKKKDTSIINWTEEGKQAFEKCKNELVNCTMLAHPVHNAQLQLRVDASDFAVGGALEQIIENEVQPLAFFSKKLTTTEQKYGTYDRELLAMYKSVKHFRDLLEGRDFYIKTDQELLQHAYRQKPEKPSPPQWRFEVFRVE